MESATARLEARIHGLVQGVGFRMFARDRARHLGLAGFVRNEPDGSVLVVAEGPRADLNALLAELRRGPRGAHIAHVNTQWAPARGDEAARFEVRF